MHVKGKKTWRLRSHGVGYEVRSSESPGRLRRSRFSFLARSLEYKQDLIQHVSTHRRQIATLLSPALLCSQLNQPALGYTHCGGSYTRSETRVWVCVQLCVRVWMKDGRNGRDPSEQITSASKGSLRKHAPNSKLNPSVVYNGRWFFRQVKSGRPCI